MRRIPGGVTTIRVRALINGLAEDVWPDTVALLLEHAQLKEALVSDSVSFAECVHLMDIAGKMIQQRLGGKDA